MSKQNESKSAWLNETGAYVKCSVYIEVVGYYAQNASDMTLWQLYMERKHMENSLS